MHTRMHTTLIEVSTINTEPNMDPPVISLNIFSKDSSKFYHKVYVYELLKTSETLSKLF